jgi:KDO2-lipid IV(A) lauroyltransferase
MKNRKNTDRILDLLSIVIIWTLRILPARLVLWTGNALGVLAGLILGRKEVRARLNLRSAGAVDPKQAFRQACGHQGKTLFEMLRNLGHSPDRALKNVTVSGLESFQAAAGEGKGILLVSGHVGNWELVSLAAARSGIPIAVVARSMRTRHLERRLIGFRKKGSVRTLLRGSPGSSITAYRWMRAGGILGCMMDRSGNGKRVLIPFLGQGMNIPLGPTELVHRLDAAVVLGWATRQEDGTTRVTFRRISTAGLGDPLSVAHAIGRALQQEMKTHPEQWLWIFRRQPSWDQKSPDSKEKALPEKVPIRPPQALTG